MNKFWTVVVTFLATTVFWICVLYFMGSGNSKSVDYTDDVIGVWIPVEKDASYLSVEFNKYGTSKLTARNLFGTRVTSEYPYSLEGEQLKLTIDGSLIHCRLKIFEEDGVTYLEIYDVTKLSGKYKKK